MKSCTKCGEPKPKTEFSKQTKARDGLRSQCKACDKAYNTEYKASHKDVVAAYRTTRKNEHKAYAAQWYADNAEARKAASAQYKADNPGAKLIYNHNYRASKRENGGKLSKGLAEKLFTLQRGKCACCRAALGTKYHRDHYIPLALGGPNEDWNMQLLCKPCNQQKHAKHPIDFMQQRGFLI